MVALIKLQELSFVVADGTLTTDIFREVRLGNELSCMFWPSPNEIFHGSNAIAAVAVVVVAAAAATAAMIAAAIAAAALRLGCCGGLSPLCLGRLSTHKSGRGGPSTGDGLEGVGTYDGG